MKNFKAGQKVVFDDKGNPSKNERTNTPALIRPKNGEIVVLKSKCHFYSCNWVVYGYEINEYGRPCSWYEGMLHPLEDYFKEQTESVVEKLESELQIEIPELV